MYGLKNFQQYQKSSHSIYGLVGILRNTKALKDINVYHKHCDFFTEIVSVQTLYEEMDLWITY